MSTEKRAQFQKVRGVFLRGATFWFRYRIDGRQIRTSLKTEDEREAHEKARTILAAPELAEAKLWEVELTAYLAGRAAKDRMSKTTVSLRKAVLMKFARYAGVYTPRLVTEKAVRAWYAAVKQPWRDGDGREHPGVSEETAQTYVRWLRTFIGHLANTHPTVRRIGPMEFPRVRKQTRQPFCTSAQVAQLLKAAPDDELRFILYCGFHAGLRRGEIAEARPEWFDLENGLLHVQRSATWETKDRDDRTIPLTSEFLAFLKRYGLRSPFMLKERPLKRARVWRYRYDFRKVFTALMRGQGMPWVTPHVMRRTFASRLVSAGVSVFKVASWLGDGVEVTQRHYAHLSPKDADIERVR